MVSLQYVPSFEPFALVKAYDKGRLTFCPASKHHLPSSHAPSPGLTTSKPQCSTPPCSSRVTLLVITSKPRYSCIESADSTIPL